MSLPVPPPRLVPLVVMLSAVFVKAWERLRLGRPTSVQSQNDAASWENVRLVGERVVLRPITLDDAEGMFGCAGDTNVTRFLPWEPAPTVESVKPFLTDQINRRKRGESLAFAIVLKETGAFVGSTDVMKLKSGERKSEAELGYILATGFWGKGLMPEAARLTLAWAFGPPLSRKRIAAYADTENVRSCRVLEKLGMERTGTETRTVKREKRLYARYEITRQAWEALQAAG